MNKLMKFYDLFGHLSFARFQDGGAGDAGNAGDAGGGGDDGGQQKTQVGGDAAAGATQADGQTPAFSLANYFDDKGNLKQGYQQHLPEEIRKADVLTRVKDINGLFQKVVNQENTIGKKTVGPINESSSQGEIDAFYNAMGRPENVDGYKLPFEVEKGSEWESYYGQDLVKTANEALHKAGITQPQYEAIMALDKVRVEAIVDGYESELMETEIKAEKSINQEFGNLKPQALHKANLAINNLTKDWKPEERQLMFGKDAGINEPQFAPLRHLMLRLFSKAGDFYNEDGSIRTDVNFDAPTLEKQIEQLRATPGYANGELKRTDRKRFDEIKQQIDALYKKRYPEK